MRKKLLALLLAISTISSTLLPAQCVFADTTGSTDVTIEESSAGNKPTPTPATITTELFHEIKAADYKKLKDIPYSEIPWGTNPDGSPLKRGEIESETDSKIEGLKVSDAYPISHEDIYIPNANSDELKKLKLEDYKRWVAYLSAHISDKNPFNPKYDFSGFHYKSEISGAALAYINSQQPTYAQDDGCCVFDGITELTNKALIAQNLLSQDDIHKTRMSRAQISYNGLFVTKDPLNGFHGDYCLQKNGHYSRKNKEYIVNHLKGKYGPSKTPFKSGDDLRQGNRHERVIRSLYSGMGPVSEKQVSDNSAKDLCN